MVIERGEIWWADLGQPKGSALGFERPIVIIQANAANNSRIQTVIVAAITSNLALRNALGNVFLPSPEFGVTKRQVKPEHQTLGKVSWAEKCRR